MILTVIWLTLLSKVFGLLKILKLIIAKSSWMTLLRSCISATSLYVSLIRRAVVGKLSGNTRQIRSPATARTRVKFIRRRVKRSNVRNPFHVVGAAVFVITAVALQGFVSGDISHHQCNNLVYSPQVGADFFVPNMSQRSVQPTATVSLCQGPQLPQALVSPAENSHTYDVIAPTLEQRQHRSEIDSQRSENDQQGVRMQQQDTIEQGTSSQHTSSGLNVSGERPEDYTVNQDFLKDEYDYSRFTHNFYDHEQGQKQILVKGRLKKHLSFWRSIGSSEFVLDVIEKGYKIPLYSMPDQKICKNNRSALLEPEFVTEAIGDLLDRGLTEKCNKINPPCIINPLTVSAQTSGKKRLILDLREVNKHVWKQKFKYEDIKVALAFLNKEFHMIKFDITSAYHFFEIAYFQTVLLGFSWVNADGNTCYYNFLVLHFGLSSASYVFIKICRPLVNKWRGEGKMVSMFLDDGFACAQDFEKTKRIGQEIKSDILRAGFVPNSTKCIWIPVQVLEFLGVVLDAQKGAIYIPERRILKSRQAINDLLLIAREYRRVPVRKVASLVGQIISMSVVIGQIDYDQIFKCRYP